MTALRSQPVVDVHSHFIPRTYSEAVARNGHPTATGGPLPAWSPASTTTLMDRHGIDVSLLSISESGVFFGDVEETVALCRGCNEEAAEIVAANSDRLGALAVLPLPSVDAAIEELDYSTTSLGLDGVVLHSNVGGVYLGDPAFSGLLDHLNRSRAVVFVHPVPPPGLSLAATQLPSWLVDTVADTTRCLATLLWYGAFERYPDISWVFAHAGGTSPYVAHRLSFVDLDAEAGQRLARESRTYLGQLHFDTALSADRGTLDALRALVPIERIVFGTDFPFASESFIADDIRRLPTLLDDSDDLRAVRGCNAQRLFPRFA